MGFSRQEYWSGVPLPSPGDLPDPGIKLSSPTLAGRFFTSVPPGKPSNNCPLQKGTMNKWAFPLRKKHKLRREDVSSCTYLSNSPYQSSLSVPKRWFFAPMAKLWGTQCRSREFWREDPQDKWFWQLLGPYAKIPQAGLVGHKYQGSWVVSPKICYWA